MIVTHVHPMWPLKAWPGDSVDMVPIQDGYSLDKYAEWEGVNVDMTDALILAYHLGGTDNTSTTLTDLTDNTCNLTIKGGPKIVDDLYVVGKSFELGTNDYFRNESGECDKIPNSGEFTMIVCGALRSHTNSNRKTTLMVITDNTGGLGDWNHLNMDEQSDPLYRINAGGSTSSHILGGLTAESWQADSQVCIFV